MKNIKICVVGLGYVGLPLAVAFGKTHLSVYGFDINKQKIAELKKAHDSMGEIAAKDLRASKIEYSSDPKIIQKANFLIIAVPTPINKAKEPDLTLVKEVSKTIGKHLKQESIVVFESTVYPGVTEEICVPIIEKYSKLKCGKDWKIAYSPERINPGDKEHTIDKIIKVVAGMDEESTQKVAEIYALICKAGVFKAVNIKTAEAAKVIENVQRDLNIALVNELSLIFKKIGIKTKDVLEAAGTKWNFHKYQPGLVGGHCIGVDPYYLTHRAKELGYHPQVILAGRKINDDMPIQVAEYMINGLKEVGKKIKDSKVLVMGLTFKENINDTRNSKALDIIQHLKKYKIEVYGHDPHLTDKGIKNNFKIKNIKTLKKIPKVDGIIVCVIHKEFETLTAKDFLQISNPKLIFMDVKSYFTTIQNRDDTLYKNL